MGDEILIRLQSQDVVLPAEFIAWVPKQSGLARATSGDANKITKPVKDIPHQKAHENTYQYRHIWGLYARAAVLRALVSI